MAKTPPKAAKPKLTRTVSEANLARLTPDRLAALLTELHPSRIVFSSWGLREGLL